MKHKVLRTLVIVGLALGAAALIAYAQITLDQKSPQQQKPAGVAGSSVGGPYSLIDQDGRAVTEKDFAGRYKLIYFGFTFCPAICPGELVKITTALDLLAKDGEAIQPLFISIDPERDTPAAIKDFLTHFSPKFRGLTGSREQIDAVLKSYRIYAAKVQTPGMAEYTMDHSSYIYFMSPDDQLVSVFSADDTPDQMAQEIRAALSYSGSSSR